ncbi:leucine-rich repeat protein 1 [Hylaeus volcanicus]|uniref:leucine-rich repeat protein 1 n=1 Tax=Hylaeus volcanicus TaxID=313075 RepID=UPI0023B808DB|nr:leucine-rich repeat protein 1 [Hylaeus volcanicus]XP_053989161.1 leucine-rich repeat protein 1 [Hylaeus volcanicus]XP_053989162.1 leucine-rich repeat protein 1 [Hylaeus volcanicus]XP_053989163.1 leucine-rich repeat protein 1 [Hylaeus volcanicus]
MKLYCNVEVNNRSAPNVVRKKSQRSVLAIGRQTVKSDDLFILWQTLQNKQGVRYKINCNVSQIFTKFINEGKATIRFLEPPHDLVIQSDIIQLKSFIHTLKLALSKKVNLSVLTISNLNPKSLSAIPKIKVVVNKSSDYPTLEGFPRTTEELYLVGSNRLSLDKQILKLQSLRILNLSSNRISSIPKELGYLQHLQELNLSQNLLNKGTNWVWLDQGPIKSNLKLLDISNNLLTTLPEQIGKLHALINLKASKNMLSYLPQSLGKLSKLKYLDLSKNNLEYMPGSTRNLRLALLDVSENEFRRTESHLMSNLDVPSLTESAARSFLKTRHPYDASLIPVTLVKFLDNAKYCMCGNPCFDCYIRKFMEFHLSIIANSVKSSENVTVPFDCYFCSISCLSSYGKIQY